MGSASLSVMDDDRDYREALTAAGHTGPRGAMLFCLILACVGALLGSVVIAIALGALVPGIPETQSTIVGALAGGVLATVLGLIKVRRGNLEAREQLEDREWRRLARRQRGS